MMRMKDDLAYLMNENSSLQNSYTELTLYIESLEEEVDRLREAKQE